MLQNIVNFVKRHKYPLVLGVMVLFLCVIPLSYTSIYTGHDLKFHLCRISCIADNMDHGKWFSPIYYTYLDGYGYAAPLFYGDFFLHIPGLLVHWGMEPVTALQIFMMIVTSSCAFVTYICAKCLFKDRLAALVTAVAYTFSSYFCVDMLIRTALGELQAFVFLPVIFLGFYSIVFEDGKKWLCLPLGLAGCLVSHVITAVTAVIFLAVFAIVDINKFKERKIRFAYIGVSVLAFIGVSAFFLFPLVEQMLSGDFAATNGMAAVQWGTLAERVMPYWALIFDFSLKIHVSQWIPNGVGLSPVACLIGAYYAQYKKWRPGRHAWTFLIAGFACLLATTSLFPWWFTQDIFGSMQFPWRLLTFVTLFFALAAGFTLRSSKSPTFTSVFAVAIIGLSVFSYAISGADMYSNMINKEAESGETVIEYKNTIGAGEYMPVFRNEITGEWVSASAIKGRVLSRGNVVTSNSLSASDITYNRSFNILTVDFENNGESDSYLEFPLLMYKGYYAEIDGKEVKAEYGTDSIVRVYLGDNESGEVTVWYKGTVVQTVSKIITVISLAAVVAYLILRKKKAATPSQTQNPAFEERVSECQEPRA